MPNLILIGQAEEIDPIQPKVRSMLEHSGIYVGGDSKNPDLLVVLVSTGEKVFSVQIDSELAPDRFHGTLTVKGPYNNGDELVNVNLEGMREQLLGPHPAARDAEGWLYHPAIPVCDEGTDLGKLLEAFAIEPWFVSMEGDAPELYNQWYERELTECSTWNPTPPSNGAVLLEIYDTEDGPVALFGRDWYVAEKERKAAEREKRRSERSAIQRGDDE